MFLDHIQWRTTVSRTPPDVSSARRKDFYLTTHKTYNWQTSMPPGGIRTHNSSRRAAADVRLRPRGYWDRLLLKITVINSFCDWLQSDFESHSTTGKNTFPTNYNLRNMFYLSAVYTYVHSSLSSLNRLRHVILNTLRTGSFKLFKRPFPRFITILTL